MVSLDQIKELRERTGVSIAECQAALADSAGDIERALAALRERGAAVAAKKAGRALGAGLVGSYVHYDGRTAVLVALGCETDFVAKSPEFKTLADDLAMHVAAFTPTNNEELGGQPFVKDPTQTVLQVLRNVIQKFGENVEVRKFVRLDAGEI